MGLFVADQGSISASIGTLVSDGGGGAGGLFGSLAAGAILIGILIFILPFVLMSILSVFILLVGRQVVLMCLVLVSSFAFVAWLLPNTENYFQKWWKLFVQLLIIYPMIMLVFGASLYLSNLIGSEAGIGIVSSDENAGVAGGALQRIVQLVILMIPLFALPGLLKGSNAIMGRIGSAANRVGGDLGVDKLGGKMKSGTGGAIKRTPGLRHVPETYGQLKQATEAGRQRGIARRSAGRSATLGKLPIGRDAQQALKAQGRNLDNKQVELAQAALQNDPEYVINSNEVAMKALRKAYSSKDAVGIRAAIAELSTNQAGVKDLHGFIEGQERAGQMDDEMKGIMARGINDNWGSIKSKDNSITSWTYSGDNPIYNVAQGIKANGQQEANILEGLTVEQLSSQGANAIEKAGGVKAINPEMAQAVLSSDAAENLTAETRKLFMEAADRNKTSNKMGEDTKETVVSTPPAAQKPPAVSGPPSATGGGSFDQQSEGGVWIPRK
jgi:hypothetical protein